MRQGVRRAAVLAVLAFGASACASSKEWKTWSEHQSHFASSDHIGFSMKNRDPYEPRLATLDRKRAEEESWWGALVPSAPPADISGRWRGTWSSFGIFGTPRTSDAVMTLAQRDYWGSGRLQVHDGLAAESMPEVMRKMNPEGVAVIYQVAGADVMLRHAEHGHSFTVKFTLVGQRLVGEVENHEGQQTRFELVRAD